ncbi:MAG: hypothetical protein ACRBFS_25955 [Aureispira sp.]
MLLDKEPFLALATITKETQQYPTSLENWRKAVDPKQELIDALQQHLTAIAGTVTIPELLPVWTEENNADWGNLVALAIYLFQETLQAQKGTPTSIAGDYVIDSSTVITGDLVVEGNLSTKYLEGHAIGLLVLGDLTIKGSYNFSDGSLIVLGDVFIEGAFNEGSDWSLTVIGGNCQANRFVKSSGELLVQGKTISPLIYVSYNHGHCLLNAGFNTLYFHESDHGRSYCFGPSQAFFIRIDEITGVEIIAPDQNYTNLKTILQAEHLGDIATVDFTNYDRDEFGDVGAFLESEHEFEINELTYQLVGVLEGGQSIFKEDVLKDWSSHHLPK